MGLTSAPPTTHPARTVRIGHTPDLDDAFMFYAMRTGQVPMNGFKVEHVIEDIQTLNQRALKGELEVTAISAAMFPFVQEHYWMLDPGASVGRNYGPLVVAPKPMDVSDLKGKRVAVPGLQTTAYLVLRLAAPDIIPVPTSFELIPEAVLSGKVDAGLLIHEKQLTYRDEGLLPILDLGMWWHKQFGLPLPLGLNVVLRSLGESTASLLSRTLKESIVFAMTHQDESLAGCMDYGRGIDLPRARQFVGMYVNEETLALSPASRNALDLLYTRAFALGLIPNKPELKFIEPSRSGKG
jgi:1,4-dihydroxy-6-naphthoate synthase